MSIVVEWNGMEEQHLFFSRCTLAQYVVTLIVSMEYQHLSGRMRIMFFCECDYKHGIMISIMKA